MPKLVEPMSWGCRCSPGTDHGPLCTNGTVITEHTVDWRCARSVPGQRLGPGHPRRHDALRRPRVDHEVAPVAAVEADGHAEGHIAGRRGHRERHRRPLLALGQGGRDGAERAGERCGRVTARRLRGRARPAPRAEVDADAAEAGQHVGTQEADGLPFPAHLGQRGGRQLLGRQADPVERPGPHRDGPGGPGAPDTFELGRRAGARQVQRWARPASMVDCPAPVSRTNGYGPLPPMHTSAVSATCPATTLTVSGTFSPPPGCAVAPSQLPTGRRQGERHLRLHVDVREAG